MVNKLIAFDIWGDYGYFRRGYTSTSTITYPFPSRTTLAGLISGILGLEKDSYHDIFSENNSELGLRILNPIKKINIKRETNIYSLFFTFFVEKCIVKK